MELVAMSNSKATKKPIRHIGLPEGAIIGGIVRNKIGHIATGDFQIEPYDNVIVFALPSAFIKVQTLFS
jgi:trk system potassium uptake protein TrkA